MTTVTCMYCTYCLYRYQRTLKQYIKLLGDKIRGCVCTCAHKYIDIGRHMYVWGMCCVEELSWRGVVCCMLGLCSVKKKDYFTLFEVKHRLRELRSQS